MKLRIYYFTIVLILFGCNKNKAGESSTDLERYILDLPEIEVSEKSLEIDKEQVSSILSRIENSISGKLFFIDYNIWTIFMANEDGTLLDKKGGVGRGPGEYLGINDLYTYPEEQMLQVFDKKLKRLTYYDVSGDSLKFSHTTQLPNYEQSYLQTVFKSNGNTVGIFRVLRHYENSDIENKIYVYYLDEELNKKEKVFEIEGAELIETEGLNGEKRFMENSFGNETVWSFNNNKLFYSNAENLSFKVYDFNDKETTSFKIIGIPEYINTSETTDVMMSRYSQIFNIHPEYETYFKERDRLPYFGSIFAKNHFLYIPIKNYGKPNRYILRYNLQTSKFERIDVPSNFSMKGVNERGIYGIMPENDYHGETTISVLEFE